MKPMQAIERSSEKGQSCDPHLNEMASPHLFLLLLLLFIHQPLSSCLSDSDALLLLKSAFLNADPALSSWSPSSAPCSSSWAGVRCQGGAVIGLRLTRLGLRGTVHVDALSHLRAIRSVSLDGNSLSGPIPDLRRLRALRSAFLSDNLFSGPVNDSMFSSMDRLKKLWLDWNRLEGAIPASLSNATALLELRLEGNRFTGTIPALNLPSLHSFNVSNNDLRGEIPSSLSNFDSSAFAGNSKLCGPPLENAPCEPKMAKPILLLYGVLLVLIASLAACYAGLRLHRTEVKAAEEAEFAEDARREDAAVAEAMEAAAAASPVLLPSHGRKLMMLSNEKGEIELAELMKSTAEMLGKGGLGAVYKAKTENGMAFAVKRMKEVSQLDRDGFGEEMRRLGRLRHPNVLPPLAYHFRNDEKLLVSEYLPNGSLLFLLHEDRGAEGAALNWETRVKIIGGIAQGMRSLHGELSGLEVPHGNLKASNVLLSGDMDAVLCDYGMIGVVSPATAAAALFAFKAPEAPHVSHKSDVYCFGVVLLEIITSKVPSLYLPNARGGTDVVRWAATAVVDGREADLVDPRVSGQTADGPDPIRLIRLGVACTRLDPEERPGMMEAADLVEDISAAIGEAAGRWIGEDLLSL